MGGYGFQGAIFGVDGSCKDGKMGAGCCRFQRTSLATAPDADILQKIMLLLTQRVRAGRTTFLVKVKSHRGEPINERADTLAEEGRGMSDDDKWWDDRTDRMTFEVRRGTRRYAQRGRAVYATHSGSKRDGLNCKRSEP